MESAREIFEKKKKELDPFYDKAFVRVFIKKVQKISPYIGAIYFPETFQLVFHYKGVIIYKIILNKTNLADISVDVHLKNIRNINMMIRNNIIPSKSLSQLQEANKKQLNKSKTGKTLL